MRQWRAAAILLVIAACGVSQAQSSVELPKGVKAVWDLAKAYREATPTRERICINGLWRWQPARDTAGPVPRGNWGYFKVPGYWPGLAEWLQQDCQTCFVHPAWKDTKLSEIGAAWYEREITIPREWAGRRIALYAEYVNSIAVVYVDGKKAGQIRFPAGELDLTAQCRPGQKYTLSLLVIAMPLKAVMMSYNDTAAPKEVRGSVRRRGLCGDVYLVGAPAGARIADVKVDTSVRRWEISFDAQLEGLASDQHYSLRAEVADRGKRVRDFTGKPFTAGDLKDGRIAFVESWKPEKLWDTNTPQNMYQLSLSLLDSGGKALDVAVPVQFGFREFWISGRDFYLNDSRIFLSAIPLDNAQLGAAAASYEGVRDTLLRMKSFGINFVYGHNYGCEPGTHVSFTEELRAADDVGMLVALPQPHFGQYDWNTPDADRDNGYAQHAEFYVRVAQNHPSVVAYAMSHNSTSYEDDENPDMMDGIHDLRENNPWSRNNGARALRAEAIVKRFDPGRIVYHHDSGSLGAMYTKNFYLNFVPIEELDDWFEHWATVGVKPLFLCEYEVPSGWDFAMYRGWYRGAREYGSAEVPWELCLAEWNSQFFGSEAFRISEVAKRCLRWESKQFRSGALWHRWDYPYSIGSQEFAEQYPAIAMYIADNWRAFRTWGVSAFGPFDYVSYWKLRDGVNRGRREFKVDWDHLQRPGFSADYVNTQGDVDVATSLKLSDWVPTPAAKALMRNNMPLLAYIGGGPSVFISKDHNFRPGETVAKQLIIINDSREPVTCDCAWSLGLPQPLAGAKQVAVGIGEQGRIPLGFELPAELAPGPYELTATVKFSTGESQQDSFTVNVMPGLPALPHGLRIALFDPKGETGKLLGAMGVPCQPVDGQADLSGYDLLVIGKGALTVDGSAPDLARVRDGLRAVVFEQTSEALEKRLGFRTQEYGLRQVFKRVPDHPLLSGLDAENLRDWRGEATILPPRLKYRISSDYEGAPTVEWCGIEVPHLWRCGCRGNVASVLIEKPARGDFLPILEGGFSLQYSPLMEYREGKGMVLFCQMDVTGRTESDPAAEALATNILRYASAWKPAPRREALYAGGPAGKRHLERAGMAVGSYEGGKILSGQVLVVGSGGGKDLAAHASDIAEFLKAGGNLLALGLDEQEANSFLPAPIRTSVQEHIASYFEPFGAGSLLAGVGPEDVEDNGARRLPLVSAGAEAFGDGVLAKAQDMNVVFCQLSPYEVTHAEGAVASFQVDAGDAADGKQSALVTMGTTTEAGGQFGQRLSGAPEVGKSYTFAVWIKGAGGPVKAHLEVERAGSPWDRAVKGPDVLVPENEWTDLHVTFKCEKPFPEGWQAYIGCAQDGGRFRADLFRLYEGDYVPSKGPFEGPADQTMAQPKNLFVNPSFEKGAEPYFFQFVEQYNLRRTYRRASFLLARLLGDMGVAGSNPLLARFGSPVLPAKPEQRWLDGLYLDQVEAWDDPYRFFGW
jgi:hypothetical protein